MKQKARPSISVDVSCHCFVLHQTSAWFAHFISAFSRAKTWLQDIASIFRLLLCTRRSSIIQHAQPKEDVLPPLTFLISEVLHCRADLKSTARLFVTRVSFKRKNMCWLQMLQYTRHGVWPQTYCQPWKHNEAYKRSIKKLFAHILSIFIPFALIFEL